MFLPLFEWEQDLYHSEVDEIRAIMYILFLVYCFIGVAIVADTFMSAIEVITSQTREVWLETEVVRQGDPESPGTRNSQVEAADGTKINKFKVKIWNDTVANLTLMALGSSAPEILLSLLELIQNEFFSGRLGPSTIVGSAAFNFLCITSICVYAIPTGEVRKIKDIPVYIITCTFSLFAYFWVLFILTAPPSEDLVEPWEGVLTFFFFPVLVLLAWAADTGALPFLAKNRENESHVVSGGRMDLASPDSSHNLAAVVPMNDDMISGLGLTDQAYKQKLAAIRAEIQRSLPKVDETTLQRLILKQLMAEEHHSRLHYRVAAIREFTGGKRVVPNIDADRLSLEPRTTEDADAPEAKRTVKACDMTYSQIEFQSQAYAVLECVDTVRLQVMRIGNLDSDLQVHYRTLDGTATGGEDYVSVDGYLHFAPGVEQMELPVKIIDDVEWEEDEVFYVELELEGIDSSVAVLGPMARATVTIINDDEPGTLTFEHNVFTVKESQRYAEILVSRRHGSSGTVGCKYRTENVSAIAGADYEEAKGTIKFSHSETSKTIAIRVHDDKKYDRDDRFKVVLYDIFGGVQLDQSRVDLKDGLQTLSCEVRIQSDDLVMSKVDVLADWLHSNADKHRLGTSNWYDQFVEALCVNGSVEEQSAATTSDLVMHGLTLPWKVMNAFVPPTDFFGGWLCFFSSLGLIALVTALVGDLASLSGCVLNVPDEVTAITFVALGTSVPDTFASKTAAVQDKWADASIGNVTGSNAVNVFLGLGLPWTIGALHWSNVWSDSDSQKAWKNHEVGNTGLSYEDFGYLSKYPNGGFIVPAQDLGFSVMVYTVCACIAIVVLCSRRITAGGELGGPNKAGVVRTAFILFALWCIYIGVSSAKIIQNSKNEAR